MRVSKWMSPKVITLQASDSISTAIHLMKEKRIRRIPIVNGGGKLVGIVSDRDLKDVSPSRATTLDIWELHAVLDKLKIGDIMTKKPVTVTPDTPIERAAQVMLEKRIEGLPVLDARGTLVGILTEGDVFRALVDITGAGKKRMRVNFVIPDRAGSIREVADAVRAQGGTIFSILTSTSKVPAGKRELVMRVEGPAPEALRAELSKSWADVAVETD
ncbi:MAG TPA: CBS and ACT domain-containing protein [Thermoanaerobaculia bacterium]|jgi:acetoin utilization protein AcuB